jgi:proteasome lid subunit RPN8/RPN11
MKEPLVADSLENLLGSPSPQDSTESIKENLVESELLRSCPPPITVIKITKVALEKIYLMAQAVQSIFQRALEVYCLVVADRHQQDVIGDILIPEQSVTYVSIHIEPENILKLSQRIREEQLTILGWAHSHADFSVFFSGTDDRNQNVILAETANYTVRDQMKLKFAYGMTVNIHRKRYGVVSTQYPCGSIQHKEAEFEIIGDLPSNWDETAEKQALIDELEQKMSKGGWFGKSNGSYERPKANPDEIRAPKAIESPVVPPNNRASSASDDLSGDELALIDGYLKSHPETNPLIKYDLQRFVTYLKSKQTFRIPPSE